MRGFVFVLQLPLVFLEGDPAKIAPISQLGGLEVATQPLEILEDLMRQFAGVARHDARVRHVLPVLSRLDLV